MLVVALTLSWAFTIDFLNYSSLFVSDFSLFIFSLVLLITASSHWVINSWKEHRRFNQPPQRIVVSKELLFLKNCSMMEKQDECIYSCCLEIFLIILLVMTQTCATSFCNFLKGLKGLWREKKYCFWKTRKGGDKLKIKYSYFSVLALWDNMVC